MDATNVISQPMNAKKCNIASVACHKCDTACNIASRINRDIAPLLYIYNFSSKRVFAHCIELHGREDHVAMVIGVGMETTEWTP